jgi:hypothetical protein
VLAIPIALLNKVNNLVLAVAFAGLLGATTGRLNVQPVS